MCQLGTGLENSGGPSAGQTPPVQLPALVAACISASLQRVGCVTKAVTSQLIYSDVLAFLELRPMDKAL